MRLNSPSPLPCRRYFFHFAFCLLPSAFLPVVLLSLWGCSSAQRSAYQPGQNAPGHRQRPFATPGEVPGPRPDGSVLLPNQWSLRPEGTQIVLGDFPVNIAVHPAGRFAAVLHCGHGRHEIVLVDLSTRQISARFSIPEAFYGLIFSKDGQRLFCSGAGDETVHSFDFRDGYLGNHRTITVRNVKETGIPAGLAIRGDGQELYVANLWAHRISQIDLASGAVRDIALGTNTVMSSSNAALVNTEPDAAAATKRAEALLMPTQDANPFPYACLADEQTGRLYISLWGQAAIAVLDLKNPGVIQRWKTEEHPNEMVLTKSGAVLFVANANRNTVTLLDTSNGRALETLYCQFEPNAPPGSTPMSLALSPDETLLFVANANINAVAVFDVEKAGQSRSLGFIPVGWYPTSVRLAPNGRQLLVANGKGILPKANRHGPQPGRDAPASVREYIGGLFQGTLSVINLPAREKLEDYLRRTTVQAYRCRPAVKNERDRQSGPNPIPAAVGGSSPIKYCIYIVKENRTYDQVLGDMPEGNGDPSLCLFPESVTPNHHQLAREFVLLDNFYVESEVSADGHEWTMGAYATDFVEKTWPMSYGHNSRKKYIYPSEGRLKIAEPAGGYLWDAARRKNVTYRSYGEFINNGPTPSDPGTTRVASLEGHFDPWFRSFDMDYPDVKRAEQYIKELNQFERAGEMPRLQIIRLPNDHTSGTAVGKRTPRALVADNDLAFGMVVEAISHSKFWPQTAIFVVEDDAQNGPDHVDAHRTIAYAISPYTRRGHVDSTMYSTASMLRTIELILGLPPLSQFDAAAAPMYHSFQARPDVRPYKKLPVTVNLEEINSPLAWGRDLSERMDFSKEDAADDLLLNEIVWRSIRGPDQPMPPPTRAAFVFPERDHDD